MVKGSGIVDNDHLLCARADERRRSLRESYWVRFQPLRPEDQTDSGAVWDRSATTVEGDERNRAVILKFESKEAALEWYNSEGYQKALPLRLNSISDGWGGIVTALD
jgi:hypothetical protein